MWRGNGKPEKDDEKKRTNPQTTPPTPKKETKPPTDYIHQTGLPDAPVPLAEVLLVGTYGREKSANPPPDKIDRICLG